MVFSWRYKDEDKNSPFKGLETGEETGVSPSRPRNLWELLRVCSGERHQGRGLDVGVAVTEGFRDHVT